MVRLCKLLGSPAAEFSHYLSFLFGHSFGIWRR